MDVNEERVLAGSAAARVGDIPIYATDSLVRRASSLQQTALASEAAIRINAAMAEQFGLTEGSAGKVTQNGNSVELPVIIDAAVPNNSVRVQSGLSGTQMLAGSFAEITLEKA